MRPRQPGRSVRIPFPERSHRSRGIWGGDALVRVWFGECRLIAVVEGLSSAGKTSWCKQNFPDLTVSESAIPDYGPNRKTDPAFASKYWAAMNAGRWAEAILVEAELGLAVCDTDPFKLHYAFSLWQVGAMPKWDWEFEVEIHRELFVSGQIGFADRYFVSIPDEKTLESRMTGDTTRSRRSFDLHSKLGPSLKHWYQAIDSVESGRVTWGFPESISVEELTVAKPRRDRSDIKLFDRLIVALTSTP